MIDTLIEKLVRRIGEQYFGWPRKLKGPKIHVTSHGRVYVKPKDMFRSEAFRANFQKFYNSNFNQELMRKNGRETGLIDIRTPEDKARQARYDEWQRKRIERNKKVKEWVKSYFPGFSE